MTKKTRVAEAVLEPMTGIQMDKEMLKSSENVSGRRLLLI
jgi:hypothetical protein